MDTATMTKKVVSVFYCVFVRRFINIYGGAARPPIGASGALVTLLNALRQTGSKRGSSVLSYECSGEAAAMGFN
jgi:hypothetical protein